MKTILKFLTLLLCQVYFIHPCYSQQKDKDTTLTRIDAIDVKLLANPSIVIKIPSSNSSAPSSKYKEESLKHQSDISSAKSKLSSAELQMASTYGKDANAYNQARQNADNAKWDKNMSENRLRESEFNNSIIQMLATKPLTAAEQAQIIEEQMQKLAKAKKNYQFGDWDDCLLVYQDFIWGKGVNSGTMNGISSSTIGNDITDFILVARAATRAADKGLVLKTKKNAYEIAFLLAGVSSFGAAGSSLDYFEKKYLSMEFINWFTKNVSKIPEEVRIKYKDWFIQAWLGNFFEFSESSKLADIAEYANSITKLIVSFGQPSFYDDMVYPLMHINDPNNSVKRNYKSPGGAEGLVTTSVGDLNFVLAAYYQENAGNKAQALEVWLHYLDYANFDWKHRAEALYLSLATKKSEELKKELGISALPHSNQNWAITNQDFENVKQEKLKDEKRKQAGLDWDNEK